MSEARMRPTCGKNLWHGVSAAEMECWDGTVDVWRTGNDGVMAARDDAGADGVQARLSRWERCGLADKDCYQRSPQKNKGTVQCV